MKTPHIQQLADTGLTFERAYCCQEAVYYHPPLLPPPAPPLLRTRLGQQLPQLPGASGGQNGPEAARNSQV